MAGHVDQIKRADSRAQFTAFTDFIFDHNVASAWRGLAGRHVSLHSQAYPNPRLAVVDTKGSTPGLEVPLG